MYIFQLLRKEFPAILYIFAGILFLAAAHYWPTVGHSLYPANKMVCCGMAVVGLALSIWTWLRD